MNDNKKFEALIARARSERAPDVDVAGKVIAILSGEQSRFEPSSDRPRSGAANARSSRAS